MRFICYILAFLLFASSLCQAQKDTISDPRDIDGIINETKALRITDSLQKLIILQQINQLNRNEIVARDRLQAELKKIEQVDSLRLAVQRTKIFQLQNSIGRYPVAPFGDTLFYILTKIGSVLPAERAERISRKIIMLYEDDMVLPDSIRIENSELTNDIIYGELIIMSVSEADAILNNTSVNSLTVRYQQSIIKAIHSEREQNSLSNILKRIGLLLIIILTLSIIIWGISKLFKLFVKNLTINKDIWLRHISIGSYELLSKEQELSWLLLGFRILRWFTIILLVYLALTFAFSIFPFSKGWAEQLFILVWSPFKSILNAVWKYLPNLITIIVLILVMKYLIRFVRYLFTEVESGKLIIPGFHADWSMPTYSIVKFLLYAFTFVLIFPYLPGSDSNIFKGVSVFIGVLFSLGSSSAIANMVAGLVITYMRPFKIGDRIRIADISGDVVEKTMLVTRLRTIKNEEITIPNSAILTGNTINYSTYTNEKGLIIHTTVTIGYDVPWKNMHEALIEAANRVEFILKDPLPFVLQTSLDDFYVAYQINAYTREANRQSMVLTMLHQNIQDVCNERGIEIMSPHYRSQRDGNATTIPGNYLPDDYVPPPFNVNQTVKPK